MRFLPTRGTNLLRRLLLTQTLCLALLTSLAAHLPTAAQQPLDQQVTLDFNSETLKAVLGQIEKQADVHFLYSRQLIGADRRVTYKAVNTPLTQVLTELLAPLELRYEQVEDGIVLTPTNATGTVTGRVVNAKGEGLPGATVLVEGTGLGGVTDVNGAFSIANVPPGPQMLVISTVGFVTQRQPFNTDGGPADVSVTLSEDVTILNEAVVVGYGTTRKQDVTGAVTTVSTRDFVQGQVTDPVRLIQGKVAGVQVTAGGGAPGEVGVIRIRGGSSLNASNDPLIVVDGVPVDNNGIAGAGSTLALINPNDIETFTVLKDASATAIYGSRASNGVIIITTKKGLAGERMHVTLNSQVSRSENYGRIDVLTGDQYRTLTEQAIAAGLISPDRRDLVGAANTDWQKEIYQTAWTTDHNVSLTGSIKQLPYRVSIGHLDQQGTLRTGYLKRNTASIGLTPRLFNDHLRIDVNAKGTWADYRFADQGAIGGAVRFAPSQPIYSGNDRYNGYFEWLDSGTGNPNSLTDRNPVALLNDKRDRSSVLRGLGNVQFDYQLPFLPELHANLNLGYDISRSGGTVDIPASSSVAYNVQGVKNRYRQERDTKLLEFYLNYTKQLGDNRVEALAGYSYQDFIRYSPAYLGLTAAGTPLDTTKAGRTVGKPFKTQYTLLSYYGRVNYSFKSRYLLTATLRGDASSHFKIGNKWGLFPAASVAWRVGQEEFLVNSSVLSELKLRASYGVTGQQDIFNAAGTDYPYLARYQYGTGSVQQQFGYTVNPDSTRTPIYVPTLRPAGYDASLKWEETTTYNAGLDYGFFNNRLTGAIDVYLRRTKDLLAVIPVPVGTNLSDKVLTNIGSLENRGVEFTLNYNVIQQEKLNWSVNFNATMNRNEITKLTQVSDPSYLGTQVNGYQINSVGYAANSFFVLKQKYDETGKPIENTTDRTKMYEDLNGDGLINERDYYRYKSPAPQAMLGFSSNLSYGGASLAFTVRSNVGNYVYNNIEADRSAYASVYPAQPFVLGALPSIYTTGFQYPQLNSDYYIRDASFVRLENVTLGYDFHHLVKAADVMRLTLAAQNVLVLTSYTGVNPEIFNGIDSNFYPLPRTVTLGLTIGF